MDDHTDDELNMKVVLIAAGGAALVALLIALARRSEDEGLKEDAKAKGRAAKKEAKKAAKAAKRKQHEIAAAVEADALAAERDLKAAAWDAQQRAREAERKLLAAGLKVVDDATHLASKVGSEARSLAGEGKERIAHLRSRESDELDIEAELKRLREQVESLQRQLRKETSNIGSEGSRLSALFAKKSGPLAETLRSPAVSAALAQFERSLRAKAPALAAAKNKGQVLDILMQDLGPTMRDAGIQAFAAALGMLEANKNAERRARDAGAEASVPAGQAAESTQQTVDEAAKTLRLASEESGDQIENVAANGKRRFWHGRSASKVEEAPVAVETAVTEAPAETEEERQSKAALFWGGAGIGLALYALLDAERREKVLRIANEASVQIQEIVRDLQGYDDEF